MAKVKARINDDKVFGLSAAAGFLQCAEQTVLKHANAGTLVCKRDTSGKRLFSLADLQKFKSANLIRNNRRAAQAVAHG